MVRGPPPTTSAVGGRRHGLAADAFQYDRPIGGSPAEGCFSASSTPLPAWWDERRSSSGRRKLVHSQHDELAAAMPAVRHLITVIFIYQIRIFL